MKKPVLFISLLGTAVATAQPETGPGRYVDSLLVRLDTTRHDTEQIMLNAAIAWAHGNSSLAQPYLERTIALCGELVRSKEPSVHQFAERILPTTLNTLALNFQRREDHLRALTCFRRSAAAYELQGDTVGMITIENNLGILFQKVGDRPRALQHYHRALSMARSAQDPMWPASLMARMGALFADMGQLDSAELYLDESLKDRVSSSIDYRYRNLALLREKQGRTDDAVALLDSSVAVSRKEGHVLIVSTSSLHLAQLLQRTGRSQEALSALEGCLEHFDGGDEVYYCQCLQAHGTLLVELGDPVSAERDLVRALTMAQEVGQLRTQLLTTASLRDLYRRSGRFAAALDMADRWQVVDDSIRAMDAKSELLMMDFKREQLADSMNNARDRDNERRVAKTRLQRERTQRNVLLFFGAFALMFAVVDYRRRKRIKQEHARSEALLLNILPEEVAKELKAKGETEAVHIDQVTVLFTDFKGFTAMSETLSPRDLVRDLNECFSAFDRITEKYGIEKIKTIGDAYMAAGGLPTPNTTHAQDVINAALEMRDIIAAGKARKVAAGLPYFEVRIGVHTGPVVAGIVGVKKFQYDIWGDTVNTASRMESSGEVGQVNISESTYALVKDESSLVFTHRGRVQAKGKGELNMYFVARK